MTVQTTYAREHAAAYAGSPLSLLGIVTFSRLNKGASVIPYGKFVVTDGENGAKLPTSGSVSADVNGIAMYELNRAQKDGDVAGAVPNQFYTVISQGVVWVKAAATVVKDDPVFARVGATNNGDASNAAGSGATLSVAMAGAKFLTGGDAGDLVQVSLGSTGG